MSSFDISQYTIEVSMNNDEPSTTSLYPPLEETASDVEQTIILDSKLVEESVDRQDDVSIIKVEEAEEAVYTQTDAVLEEVFLSAQEIADMVPVVIKKTVKKKKKVVEISSNVPIEPKEEEPNFAQKEEEIPIVQKASVELQPEVEFSSVIEISLTEEVYSEVVTPKEEQNLNNYILDVPILPEELCKEQLEEISISSDNHDEANKEEVSSVIEISLPQEDDFVAEEEPYPLYISPNVITLEEEGVSISEDVYSFSFKNFTIPESTDDPESWNRWLFTQLKHVLETKGGSVAIVEEIGETRCVTYGELMDGVMKTANYLKHHTVGEGTVVGFCMESTFEFILYELACFFLGALPVLFHPSHMASDKITRLNLKIMIVDADHYGHVLRSLEYFGDLEKIFILADDLTTVYLPRTVWIYDGLGFLDFNCDLQLQLGKSNDNVIAFATSGTSSSKGKLVAHRKESCKAICTHYYTEFTSLLKEKHPEENADVHLISTGLHTIDGFSYSIYSLINGHTLLLTETNADVWKVSFLDRIAGLIERYQLPMLMVHSQFLKCFKKYEIHKIYNVSSLKLLCHSGSCLSPAAVQYVRDLGLSITQVYSTTETGVFSCDEVTASKEKIPSCGEPFLGNNVKILDLDENVEVAPGQWGRLLVQGPTLFSEYLCDAKFAKSCSNGWFFTGDFATLDEQTRLFVAGPLEGVIKQKTAVVSLMEAENVLVELSSVDDVAIAKVKEEVIVGIVVTEGVVPPSLEDVNSILKENKIKLKIDRIVIVDFIPRSETGKLLRNDLPFLFEIEPELDHEDIENVDELTVNHESSL